MTLSRIVVDLTPLVPGGENGGAKIVAMETVRGLSRLIPECQFLLLTHERSHNEPACLDAPNVRRRCVDHPGAIGSPDVVSVQRKSRLPIPSLAELTSMIPPPVRSAIDKEVPLPRLCSATDYTLFREGVRCGSAFLSFYDAVLS
jgi:hypothetical protein